LVVLCLEKFENGPFQLWKSKKIAFSFGGGGSIGQQAPTQRQNVAPQRDEKKKVDYQKLTTGHI
jgi:hypothetical protein